MEWIKCWEEKNHQPEFYTLTLSFNSKYSANIYKYMLSFNGKYKCDQSAYIEEITVQLWKIVLGDVNFWQDWILCL